MSKQQVEAPNKNGALQTKQVEPPKQNRDLVKKASRAPKNRDLVNKNKSTPPKHLEFVIAKKEITLPPFSAYQLNSEAFEIQNQGEEHSIANTIHFQPILETEDIMATTQPQHGFFNKSFLSGLIPLREKETETIRQNQMGGAEVFESISDVEKPCLLIKNSTQNATTIEKDQKIAVATHASPFKVSEAENYQEFIKKLNETLNLDKIEYSGPKINDEDRKICDEFLVKNLEKMKETINQTSKLY